MTPANWRSEFARTLRMLGVEANATERAVRGETKKARKDGIYRASLRGDSTYALAQAQAAAQSPNANSHVEPGKRALVETRWKIESGWQILADNLARAGRLGLARDIQLFVNQMPPPRTERELIAARVLERNRDRDYKVTR